MPETSLPSIRSQLDSECQRLDQRASDLKAELQDVDAQLRKIKAALKALHDAEKPKQAPRKPSASQADVIAIISDIVRADQVVPKVELRREVDRRVANSGKSRMGLALRMKEALADSRFQETDQGIRLAGAAAATNQSPSH